MFQTFNNKAEETVKKFPLLYFIFITKAHIILQKCYILETSVLNVKKMLTFVFFCDKLQA